MKSGHGLVMILKFNENIRLSGGWTEAAFKVG